MAHKIAIYGAYGHTGKFIIAQLCANGYQPLLTGRNKEKLSELEKQYPHLKTVVSDIGDPNSLDEAFAESTTIINCAGPFLDTAEPIIQSALRLQKNYIDLSAEQKAVLDVFENFSVKAKQAGIIVLPAVAFYGGLGDLLTTALTAGWDEIDDINLYIGLDSWHPTKGTRLTGDRNHYQRLVLDNGQLVPVKTTTSISWNFPEPISKQEMIPVPLSEIITISRHLKVKNINTYLSQKSIEDIRSDATPEPKPVDKKNRSSQQFCLEVVATKGNIKRMIYAKGQDIYAVTAPLVVEAINRIKIGKLKTKGVSTLGEIFNAGEFLKSLSTEDILISKIEESEK